MCYVDILVCYLFYKVLHLEYLNLDILLGSELGINVLFPRLLNSSEWHFLVKSTVQRRSLIRNLTVAFRCQRHWATGLCAYVCLSVSPFIHICVCWMNEGISMRVIKISHYQPSRSTWHWWRQESHQFRDQCQTAIAMEILWIQYLENN